MKITIKRDILLRPLAALSGVIDKRQSLPILSHALLTMKDDRLILTGTDMEVELQASVPVLTQAEWHPLTVSGRKLLDICRTLPEDSSITLDLYKNNLQISSGDSVFSLNTLSAQDFPRIQEEVYQTTFHLKQTDLKQLFSKTYFAMGQQDVRHYLNGALLDIKKNKIQCVAADGHRLALAATEIEGEMPEVQVILPRKSVLELLRLLDNEEEESLHVSVNDQRIRFETKHFILTSKLIHAQYPDFERLIPKGNLSATLERETVKHALARTSILSNEKFRGVRFALNEKELKISANNADQEHAEEIVPLHYTGDQTEIGFNASYLMDVFSTLSTKLVRFVFTDANSGVLLHAEDDLSALYVVMPMRL